MAQEEEERGNSVASGSRVNVLKIQSSSSEEEREMERCNLSGVEVELLETAVEPTTECTRELIAENKGILGESSILQKEFVGIPTSLEQLF